VEGEPAGSVYAALLRRGAASHFDSRDIPPRWSFRSSDVGRAVYVRWTPLGSKPSTHSRNSGSCRCSVFALEVQWFLLTLGN
jgi:hypothetical protein